MLSFIIHVELLKPYYKRFAYEMMFSILFKLLMQFYDCGVNYLLSTY